MKSLKKYALPFLVVFSSGLGFSSPIFAQPSPYTQQIINDYDGIMDDMDRFIQIVERQNQLRYPCQQGNQSACAEIQQLDREIERMTQRLNRM